MKIEKNKKDSWQGPVFQLFAIITGWIIGPIILALFVGNWLDTKYDTGNKYLLITVIVAFFVTNIGLVKVSFDAIKQIDKQSKEGGREDYVSRREQNRK